MINSTRALTLVSALLFSMGAVAQTGSTAPNMRTTPDGKTPTPDATAPASSGSSSDKMTHKKHSKKMDRKSSGTSDSSAPNMQTTPDGVTKTPDATSPATR